jgi:NAD(P)-dependent dehydrogenase (short-subunit alcohol dehydrogenase family)
MPIPPQFDIAGKVFVAVGAGRGIGRGIVEVFAEAGAEGAVVALTPQYVQPLAERLSKSTGRRITGIAADGTSREAMDGVIARVLQDYGRIDVWINAVGDAIRRPLVPLPGKQGPGEPIPDDELRRVLDINLTATIVGCRAIGSYFLQQGRGTVINLSSSSGIRGGADISIYTAGKAGVDGITRALALEWAPYGVTVNCISPGTFPDPPTWSQEQMTRIQERVAGIPLGRLGDVRDAGYLAVYLASEAAIYMTGQVIHLDGGQTL